jgi:hypothetical protein
MYSTYIKDLYKILKELVPGPLAATRSAPPLTETVPLITKGPVPWLAT